jgi:hypothetical protein
LLLYLVGDPADVAVMWEAKHINMDTGCGFDGQFLVGATPLRTKHGILRSDAMYPVPFEHCLHEPTPP